MPKTIIGPFVSRTEADFAVRKENQLVLLPAGVPGEVQQPLSVGDCFLFGHYPQGRDGTSLPIVWQVLRVSNGLAYCITQKVLDCCFFDNADGNWERSALRRWLNESFLREAFTPEEQSALSGRLTLPASRELTGTERLGVPTAWAVKKGVFCNEGDRLKGEPCCRWWLRSAGTEECLVHIADSMGSTVEQAHVRSFQGVRPAVWLTAASPCYKKLPKELN